ncbi:cyclic AMP-responsive element-binding protein 1-like isoform 2-T2 [Synchiropus picturatus]
MSNKRDLPSEIKWEDRDVQSNYHICQGCHGEVVVPDSHYLLDASQKRADRLMKNRKAVQEFRQRKKRYIETLESRAAKLQKENEALVEELEALKSKHGFKLNI